MALTRSQGAEEIPRALNILRTHYSPSQRAIFAAERATPTGADTAKFRKSTDSKFRVGAPATVGQAAAEAGVSQSQVSKAKALTRTAAPGVVDQVKAGKLTLHAASRIADLLATNERALL